MDPRALLRISLAAGIIGAIGAAGCSLVSGEDGESSNGAVSGGDDVSQVLKSVLQLQGGCTAAKVGPKHLLVAARCVNGNALYAAGKTITFTPAAANKVASAGDAGADAARDSGPSGPSDASAADAADAGAKDAGSKSNASSPNQLSAIISAVKINPSYAAKCVADACAFDKVAASDSPDIAVIILEEELDSVPTVPVDLDPVGAGDPLLAVTSACATFDAKPTAAQKTFKTEAALAKSVTHAGSPYKTQPQLVSRVDSAYVVTPGAAWKKTGPKLCASDIGAPLFRAGTAAVAGVTSTYTTYAGARSPVTTEHTRVDATSRFKIGTWLTNLGATTTHSCSETETGCETRTFDGGTPPSPTDPTDPTEPSDAGADARVLVDSGTGTDSGTTPTDPPAPEAPADTTPHEDQLGNDNSNSSNTSSSDDEATDAGPKKKAADKGGCSAAPGGTSAPGGGVAIGLALAIGAVIARRKKTV